MRRVVLLGAIWGWSFLLIKVGVRAVPPATLATLRIGLGAAVLVVVSRAAHLPLPPRERRWHLAGYALFSCALPFVLFAWGEQRVPSALAGVLNGATPVATVLVGLAWRGSGGDDVRPRALGGVALGLAGVAVVCGIGTGALAGPGALAGTLACVVAAASYGVGLVWSRRYLGGLAPLGVATGQLLWGTAMLAPFGLWAAAVGPVHLTAGRVAALGVLGAVNTGFAFVLFQRAIADVGATRASLVTYVSPVVAVALGVGLLGEPASWRLLAGGALVAVGVALTRPRPGRSVAAPIEA